jgi:hypothetical protein
VAAAVGPRAVLSPPGIPVDLQLGKDGFTRPIGSGQPVMELVEWVRDSDCRI